jgi:hypothetical protein
MSGIMQRVFGHTPSAFGAKVLIAGILLNVQNPIMLWNKQTGVLDACVSEACA